MGILYEKDIKDIILQANIDGVSNDNIFFGWKQNKKAQEKQVSNKFNVAIIKLQPKRIGAGYAVKNNKHIYNILNNFKISVFNWWTGLPNGDVFNEKYDCFEDYLKIKDIFTNTSTVANISQQDEQNTGLDEGTGFTYFEYFFNISIITQYEIETNKTLDFFENAKVSYFDRNKNE